MKILVLGASGMIGNAMLRVLSENTNWAVVGTVRAESDKCHFAEPIASRMVSGGAGSIGPRQDAVNAHFPGAR